MKKIYVLLMLIAGQLIQAQSLSEFIHVDQFGYLPNMQKVAVLSNPINGYNSSLSYTPPAVLEVRDVSNDAMVFSAAPAAWNSGSTHFQSGDQGWWFDFSTLTDSGSYYIYDAINNQRSAYFDINENVYDEVLKTAGRMFYYNRCGMEKTATHAGNWADGESFNNSLQDTECRYINDAVNASLEKDLSGGWFDAGDYNKYVTFTHGALHNMLSAYEEKPAAFNDNWNIPESGNGIPDLIDEIKWELDWLFKMVNSDGSVHIKMGSQNYSENTNYPPSNNFDQRFYGSTCTSASVTIASVFAHAAKVFELFPSLAAYANELRTTAVNCFNYAAPFVDTNNLETDCDDGSIVAGDADQPISVQMAAFITAAIYLYEYTDDSFYQNYIITHTSSLDQFANNFWGPYFVPTNDALLLYASLSTADVATSSLITSSFIDQVSNDYNGFWGFSTDDLYRASMPDWSYHWGSNQAKASYGTLNALAANSGTFTDIEEDLWQYVDECIHYFHGVNPQSLVYLSNMYAVGGDKCVNEIYHAWFADGSMYDNALTSSVGPAPGYISGGPNQNYSYSDLTPPFNQPIQKSYLDFNTSWPENSWEISEPAIYYQAAYLRLLANVVESTTVPGILVQASAFLEGSYNSSTNSMNTTLRDNNLLPNNQPFNTSPWWYNGTEAVATVNDLPANMVDWVLLEARSADNDFEIVEQRAAILLDNGQIIDVEDAAGVNFYNLTVGATYYLSIKVRNHMAVISQTSVSIPNAANPFLFNAANVNNGATQLKNVGDGNYALKAGDYNADGVIIVADFNGYLSNMSSTNQYVAGDFNGDGNVTTADFNIYLLNASTIGMPQIRY